MRIIISKDKFIVVVYWRKSLQLKVTIHLKFGLVRNKLPHSTPNQKIKKFTTENMTTFTNAYPM